MNMRYKGKYQQMLICWCWYSNAAVAVESLIIVFRICFCDGVKQAVWEAATICHHPLQVDL